VRTMRCRGLESKDTYPLQDTVGKYTHRALRRGFFFVFSLEGGVELKNQANEVEGGPAQYLKKNTEG